MLIFEHAQAIELPFLRSLLAEHWSEAAGALESFSLLWQDSNNARIGQLDLYYQGSYASAWPQRLFIKACTHQAHWFKASEYHYYTRDYLGLPQAPLPHCYAASMDASGNYTLILEDLSQSHYDNKEHPPTLEHVQAVARELARLHAYSVRQTYRADQARASEHYAAQFSLNCQKQLHNYFAHIETASARFFQDAAVLRDDKALAQQILKFLPQVLQQRVQKLAGLTLLHGDLNPSNVLSPRAQGQTLFIDRQAFIWSLRHGPGVFDLAYMAVPFWSVERRRVLEEAMLRTYWQSLQKCGVEDYAWEQCWQDYLLGVAQSLCVALSWGASENFQAMQWLWQEQWQRSLQAVRDWDVLSLLEKLK